MLKPSPRVWVPHPVKHDLSAALPYGSIHYINSRYIYSDEVDNDHHIPKEFHRAMRNAADEYNPDDDFLLLTGDYLQFTQLAVMIMSRHQRLRVLRYDQQAEGYVVVEF